MADNEYAVDPLTGLPTKDGFDEFLRQAVDSHGEDGVVSLALYDVDHFHGVNVEYGRDTGDLVLKTIVRCFLDHLPSERASLCRLGGDEFAVIMPGIEKEQAFLTLETARAEIGVQGEIATVEPRPSVSVGIASYPDDGSTRQELIRKADDALYRAKTTGRNKVSLAREEKKVPKTSHYTQGQLERLTALSTREAVGEAELLREALDDLLKKYTS